MSKITPGAWTAFIGLFDEGEEFCVGIPGTPKAVALCGVVGAADEAESMANTRLIAAAPDLLEALKELKAAIRSRGVIPTVQALVKTDAAIAKATGETP